MYNICSKTYRDSYSQDETEVEGHHTDVPDTERRCVLLTPRHFATHFLTTLLVDDTEFLVTESYVGKVISQSKTVLINVDVCLMSNLFTTHKSILDAYLR